MQPSKEQPEKQQDIPQIHKQPYLSKLINKIPDDQKISAVPLEFQYIPVQILSKQFTKFNNPHKYRIHYLGPRPINSFILHKKYGSIQYQKHTQPPLCSRDFNKYEVNMRKIVQSNYINEGLRTNHHYKNAIFYRAFQGMNPTLNLKEQIIFNSAFQSGNLDCVIKPKPDLFDLFLRIDSNTRGHAQWYYFSIKNGKKGQRLKLNICNITKGKTLYQQGMKPYILSRIKKQNNPKTYSWEQGGQEIVFEQKNLRYQLVYENIKLLNTNRLSFYYQFQYDNDQVFFAYSIPFTYSQLIDKIHHYPQNIVKKSILGKTFTGVQIPVLHITNFQSKQNSFQQNNSIRKKNILVSGRVHPGESNSSHMVNGFIDFLISDNKDAIQLRNRVNFFIVPMVNIDGVIMGNSRTSAAGKDLNRQFKSCKYQLYPEVLLIKNLAKKLRRNYGMFMYLDFHGHSRKKNTFFYGPPYSLSESEYYKCRAFPRLVQKINNSFRYYGCSFNLNQQKRKTGRGVMFEQIMIPYTYTIESSIGLYYDFEDKLTIEFEEDGWKDMGVCICTGLSQFIVMEDEYEKMIKQRISARIKAKQLRLLSKVGGLVQSNIISKSTKQFQIDGTHSTLVSFQQKVTQMEQKTINPFQELLQEVKQSCIKASAFQQQVSSDDHDMNQDMQQSKLNEFNNLIVQSAHRDEKVCKKTKHYLEDQFPLQTIPSKEIDNLRNSSAQIKTLKNNKKSSKKKLDNLASGNIKIRTRSLASRSQHSRKKQQRLPRKSESPVLSENKKYEKNFVQANKQRYSIVTKNLLDNDINKYQVIELPKHIQNIRKQLTKGRILINNLFQNKLKAVQEPNNNIEFRYSTERHYSTENKPEYMINKHFSRSPQKRQTISSSIKTISDLVDRRSSTVHGSRKSVPNRLVSRNSLRKERKPDVAQNYDYHPFINLEIDNMAMTIKAFKNK